MARPVLPTLQEFRRTQLAKVQVHTFSYALRTIALGRLPGEQQLSRRAVVSRLLVALVLSLTLWVYTTDQQNPVVTHIFSLQVVPRPRILPANLAIRSTLPSIRVVASGLESSFNGANTLSAYVDLSSVSPNAREVTVPVYLSGRLHGIQYSVTPANVLLELEQQQTVQMPVTFNVRSSLPNTLEQVGEPQLSPVLVTISGPASEVKKVAGVIVAAPLDGVAPPPNAGATTFTVPFTITPQLLDRSGNQITDQSLIVSPSAVRVSLQVNVRYEQRNLSVIPYYTSQLPAGYVIGPQAPQASPSTIFVLGSPQALGDIQSVLTAPINVSEITHSMTVTSYIELPPNVIAFPGTTGSVDTGKGIPCQVYISVSKPTTNATLIARVVTSHLGRNLQVSGIPQWANVYVTGANVDIAHVVNLQARVDLTNLGPGSYDLPVTVNMPKTLPRYAVAPSTVQVTISEIATPTPTVTSTPRATPIPTRTLTPIRRERTPTPVRRKG